MFNKFKVFFIVLAVFIFVVSCDDNKKSDKDDIQISDSDTVSDEEIDDAVFDDETDEQPDELTDDPVIPADEDEIADEDTVKPVTGVYGTVWIENDSTKDEKVFLYECGADLAIATSDMDSSGNFEIEYVLESSKTYCVESNDFFSCFTAENDVHKAQINPLTHLAFMEMHAAGGCAKLRDAEKSVRAYMKVGTGIWLGELDYSELTGIHEGFESVMGMAEKSKVSEIIEAVLSDIEKNEDAEFIELFNGFKIMPEQDEVIIENVTSPVKIVTAGGSAEVSPGFKIKWQILDEITESGSGEIWSDNAGQYVVRAELLISTGTVPISESSTTVTFFKIQKEGVIDVSDMSADMSYWFNDSSVAVFAAGTEIKKNDAAVLEIGYKLLSSGGGSQISKIAFSPSGTIFLNDMMFIMIDLDAVFSGDPIMLGVERVDGAGEMSVLNQASGDPIMLTASGDPIMFTASGDPIMNIASGDPIMSGTMSNVLVTATSHFSDFSVRKMSIPVKTAEILDRWENDFSIDDSPYSFIYKAIELYKLNGAAEMKKFFAGRNDIREIEGDIDRVFNVEVGNIRNFNIFENLYFIDSLITGFTSRKAGIGTERYTAVYNGFDIRNVIFDMYLSRMSFDRSVTFPDILKSSLLPATLIKKDRTKFPDIRKSAAKGILKMNPEDLDFRYIVSKKEAINLLKYINIAKGPSFGVLNGLLLPGETVCVWLSGKTTAQCKLTPGVYSLNAAGRVTLDGKEIAVSKIENVFSSVLRPLDESLTDGEKHELFRTLYLILTYASNVYENGPDIVLFSEGIRKMVVEMFDGIESNSKAVKLVDSINTSSNTVAVVSGVKREEVPMFGSMTEFFEKVNVLVPAGFGTGDTIDVITLKIRGYGYDLIEGAETENRPVYEIVNDMGIKTFTVKNVDTADFVDDNNGNKSSSLATLFQDKDLNSFGDCYGEISSAVVSTVNGQKQLKEKKYIVNTGSLTNAESYTGALHAPPAEGTIEVMIYDENWSPVTMTNAGIVLNPGNIAMKNKNGGSIIVKNLNPSFYVIEAFAEGYYPQKRSVVLNKGDSIYIDFKLNKIETLTEKGSVQLNFDARTEGGGSTALTSSDTLNVYIVDHNSQIVKQFMDIDGSQNLNVTDLVYGQYTVKVASQKFYTLIETIVINQPSYEFFFTLETKNICGNGIVENPEECDRGMGTGGEGFVFCKDIVSDALYPDNEIQCGYDCTYDTFFCYNKIE